MTAITAPFAARFESKTGRRLLLLIGAVVAVLLYLLFQGQGTLPHDEAYPVFDTLNGVRAWIEENRRKVDQMTGGTGSDTFYTKDVQLLAGLKVPLGASGARLKIGPYFYRNWYDADVAGYDSFQSVGLSWKVGLFW